MYVCMYVSMHVCTYICMYVRMYVCTMSMYVHADTSTLASFDSSDKLEEKLTEYVPVALNSEGGRRIRASSSSGNTWITLMYVTQKWYIMHTHTHTYIHTYIHAYIHTYIHM